MIRNRKIETSHLLSQRSKIKAGSCGHCIFVVSSAKYVEIFCRAQDKTLSVPDISRLQTVRINLTAIFLLSINTAVSRGTKVMSSLRQSLPCRGTHPRRVERKVMGAVRLSRMLSRCRSFICLCSCSREAIVRFGWDGSSGKFD